eukprot:jgi/Mesen1/6034/ME000308S05228
MGAAESRNFLSGHQDLLEQFVGPTPIALTDDFWDNLLSFPYPLTKLKESELDEATQEAATTLALNTRQTGHFAKLLVHVRQIVSGLSPPLQKHPIKAINALYFTRLFLKHLVECYDGKEVWELMLLSVSDAEAEWANLYSGHQNLMEPMVRALLSFVGNFEVNVNTYVVHLEVINALLVMGSTQMHAQLGLASRDSHDDLAGPVVRKLLIAYIAKLALPPRAPYRAPAPNMNAAAVGGGGSGVGPEPGGVLRKVGSAAVAVLLLPYYTYAYLTNVSNSGLGGGKSPLAESSLLLLLVLVHYGKQLPQPVPDDAAAQQHASVNGSGSGSGNGDGKGGAEVEPPRPVYAANPFRAALQTARDTDSVNNMMGTTSAMALEEGSVCIPFAALYDTLGACLMDDRSTLVLYSLVHGNGAFLEYLLVRADLDTIVLPGVPWYKERLLPKISLGSLMVVILIRTIKYNLSKLRDVYLHTNCLAALANMAPHVHHLNAYASQRLRANAGRDLLLSSNGGSGGSSSSEHQLPSADTPTELHIYTDFLRIVLEIINAILTYALPRNPEVVYALLHRQEVFEAFRHHPRFYELLDNIFTVIEFFNVRMDDKAMEGGEWSVERVLDLVVGHTRAWRADGLKMFTELRFTYEEELHPEEFFVPYVWSLVFAHSQVPWYADYITLFPVRPVAELEEIYDADAFDANSDYAPTPREQV